MEEKLELVESIKLDWWHPALNERRVARTLFLCKDVSLIQALVYELVFIVKMDVNAALDIVEGRIWQN